MLTLVPNDTEERFLVHANLLASQSECLGSLIKNMPEGPQPELDIGSWDSATVGRFIEFVYTGDYHCPDPVPLETPAATPEGGSILGRGEEVAEIQPPTEPVQDSEAEEPRQQYWLPRPQSQPRKLVPIVEMFAPGILNPNPKLSAAESFARKYFHPAQHDFEEVFLAHAKIYAVARNLEVEDLCILALQRFLRTLVNIGPVPLGSVLVSNFVDLARFVYAVIAKDQDPFKDLVSQFAALNFTSMQTPEMTKLIRGGGNFASDLMEKISMALTSVDLGDGSKQQELNKEIEGLRREVLEGSAREMENMKEVERLKSEALEGSNLQKYMRVLKKELLVGNMRAHEDLKEQMAEFKVEMLKAWGDDC